MSKSPKRISSSQNLEGVNKKQKILNDVDSPLRLGNNSESSNEVLTPFNGMIETETRGLSNSASLSQNIKPVSGLVVPKLQQKKLQSTNLSSQVTVHAPNTKKSLYNNEAPQQNDPDKLSDALLSAGVDIREEEALLNSTLSAKKLNSQVSNSQIPPHPPFLHPVHVSDFMKRVTLEQTFNQDFSKNIDILNLMSTACELYIRDIITNSLIISRHRRKSVKINNNRKSEVLITLRNLALQQKEQEERRVKRRIALGLEKDNSTEKIDDEETLHRASNATAHMMIAGGKKKYSWLTSAVKSNSNDMKNSGKVSTVVAARGELGIKYREAREEPGIVMRDLLHALENRRVGVNKIIAKGYARIRD